MRIYCIADNQETEVGLKLAGCDGVTLNDETQILNKIDEVIEDESVGVLLITNNIYNLAKKQIDGIRLNKKIPLIAII